MMSRHSLRHTWGRLSWSEPAQGRLPPLGGPDPVLTLRPGCFGTGLEARMLTATCTFVPPFTLGLDCANTCGDGLMVLHAHPGVLLQQYGDVWRPVYLPALAPYLVHDLEPRANFHGHPLGAVVRVPEGPKGRLAKLEQRLSCVESPTAAAPCEGDDSPNSREWEESRPGFAGHRWRSTIHSGIYCVRCRCSGDLRPLVALPALVGFMEGPYRPRGNSKAKPGEEHGAVTCFYGDAETQLRQRMTMHEFFSLPKSVHDARIVVTAEQDRRALLARARGDFDAGGRWQLPDDVTPDTAPPDEAPLWVDLAALLLSLPTPAGAPERWQEWLDGGAEAPPRLYWDQVFYGELCEVLAPRLACDGPPIYLDARKVLAALCRTGIEGHIRHEHPAQEIISRLRTWHSVSHSRADRPSLLVLFPPADDAIDRETGLGSSRRLWASER